MKRTLFKILSLLSLIVCLVLAWLNFSGQLTAASFKLWFFLVSLAYFVLATLAVSKNPAN